MCFMIVGVGYEGIVSRTLGGWVKQGTRVDIIPSRLPAPEMLPPQPSLCAAATLMEQQNSQSRAAALPMRGDVPVPLSTIRFAS